MRRLPLLLALALLGGLSLGACQAPASTGAPATKPTTAPAPPAAAKPADAPVAAAPPTVAPTPEPVKVRWGGQRTLTDAAAMTALERGYFREEGIDFEYVNFGSASEIVPAVATNQLEVGGISPNPATLNALSRGLGIKLVGDRGVFRPGFGWIAIIVRNDHVESGRYRSPADLRGMNVAITPPLGATAHAVAMARLLDREGLPPDSVTFTPLSFGDMNPALANRSIDAAFHSEPLMSVALAQNLAVRSIGSDEIYPNQQLGVVSFGPDFVRDRSEAGRRFMVAYVRGIRDFVDAFTKGTDRAAVVAGLARYSSVSDPAAYDRITPTGFNPDGYINVDSIAADQEYFVSTGVQPQRVDLATVIDHQYVDHAIGRLGRYQP
jgi:NitT/TauT family transport system substrate-binding protein